MFFLARRRIVVLLFVVVRVSHLLSGAHADSTKWEKISNVATVFGGLLLRRGHVNTVDKLGQRIYGLKVIGGGFPRTGTKTIETALAMMGHKVYDNRAMIEHDHYENWTKATELWVQNGDLSLTRQIVDEVEALGFTVTLDVPMNLLAPQLIRVRPDAKVLWSYRAKGVEDWYKSLTFINWFLEPLIFARPFSWMGIFPNIVGKMAPLQKMILDIKKPALNYPEHLERPYPWYEKLKDDTHHMETDGNLKQQFVEAYTSWPSKLQAAVVEMRGEKALTTHYLEYTVQEGWDPLLEFLLDNQEDRQLVKESLVAHEFPHVNDRSTLTMVKRIYDFLGLIFPLLIATILLSLFLILRKSVRLVSSLVRLVAPTKHESREKME